MTTSSNGDLDVAANGRTATMAGAGDGVTGRAGVSSHAGEERARREQSGHFMDVLREL